MLPGYCGADIKALCTEAALVALRRRYPQIYSSSVKLKLDITSIVLGPGDFIKAMRTIVPASQRALAPAGRALSPTLRPLLAASFSLVLKALLRVFPHAQFSDRDNMHCKNLRILLWTLSPASLVCLLVEFYHGFPVFQLIAKVIYVEHPLIPSLCFHINNPTPSQQNSVKSRLSLTSGRSLAAVVQVSPTNTV